MQGKKRDAEPKRKSVNRQVTKSTKKPPEKAGKGSSLFKFRRYKKVEGGKNKKAKHPKLIVDEAEENFGFMGLTESAKRGHHKNIELSKNPQKGNTDKAYLRKEIRYEKKDKFSEALKNYNLSAEDKQKVLEYIKKIKKRK